MLGENIRRIRISKSLSQAELAGRIGYKDRSTIAKIEAGTNDVTQSKLAAIAEALGVTPAELLGYEVGSIPSADNISPLPAMKEWPVLGATACGEPIHKELENETVLAPVDIKADFVFRCSGDSMIGARILDGDIVFVKFDNVADGDIAVVRIGDEYTLKRIYRGPDYLELRAENPAYPPQIIRGEQVDAEIIGKAVYFLSRVV